MKTSSSLSRREKLLLGLLSSTLVFSASFSYGAVNSNKVDSIMKMITDGGTKFSDIPVSGQSKSERTQYFEKVDAGLGDAVEMLAVVRNNIRSLMGLSPAYTADDIVGSILGGVMSGVSGNGNSGNASNPNPSASSAWSSATSISCPTSLAGLQSANPSTISSTNSTGIQYTSVGGVFFNVKNYANASDTALPTSCTAGQKWIAKSGTNSCSVYSCGNGSSSNNTTSPKTAQEMLGIFANDPIPAPCPTNTIMMKEDLGKPSNGSWLHRTWNNKNPALGTYHVYRLTLKESAAAYKEMLKSNNGKVSFDSAETNGVVGGTNYTHIKISPYPCDFVSQSELDAAKAQGYGFRGAFGACGHSNLDVSYKIDGVDDPKNKGNCTLKLGGTYYVNVGPSPSLSNTPESGYTYSILNRWYGDITNTGLYGIYTATNGEDPGSWYRWRDRTNSSGEDVEGLRKKVVAGYQSGIPYNDNPPSYFQKPVASTPFTSYTTSNASCKITFTEKRYGEIDASTKYIYKEISIGDPGEAAKLPLCTQSNIKDGDTSSVSVSWTGDQDPGCKSKENGKFYKFAIPSACETLCKVRVSEAYIRGNSCLAPGQTTTTF